MAASYREPAPEDEELEALFKTFDRQLREVQQKFTDLEKDIAAFRDTPSSDHQDDRHDEDSTPRPPETETP